jgi:hypothetical protein
MGTRRLTESQLRRIIRSEVSRARLNESLEAAVEQALNSVSSKIESAVEKLPPGAEEALAEFLMDTFGTDQPEISAENAEILASKLRLDGLQESFKENESLATKALVRLGQVLGINAYALGIPTTLMAAALGAHASAAPLALGGGMILSAALLGVINRVTQARGYDFGPTGLGEKPDYDPMTDRRR